MLPRGSLRAGVLVAFLAWILVDPIGAEAQGVPFGWALLAQSAAFGAVATALVGLYQMVPQPVRDALVLFVVLGRAVLQVTRLVVTVVVWVVRLLASLFD